MLPPPHIYHETAIEWAKTKRPDELRAMIEDWRKDPTPREQAKSAVVMVAILCLLAVTMIFHLRADQHVAFSVGKWISFLSAIVLTFKTLRDFQRLSNLEVTARHALRLQEADIKPPPAP